MPSLDVSALLCPFFEVTIQLRRPSLPCCTSKQNEPILVSASTNIQQHPEHKQ